MSLPSKKHNNHGYAPAQLLNHSSQHDNGMSYNHVTPTIPSTIAAGSAQPYSAPGGGGSTGNIRNNYAPSTGHVNQPSAVTLPVSQVPTPSNTPPVLPDPKLHYINANATMLRDNIMIRSNYYPTPPVGPVPHQPQQFIRHGMYRSAANYIGVYNQNNPLLYAQPLRQPSAPQQFNYYLVSEPRQAPNYAPQPHYAVPAGYSVPRQSYVVNNIVPQTSAPVVPQPIMPPPAVHGVATSESSQPQEKKRGGGVVIQDPNTLQVLSAGQLANADIVEPEEKTIPPNILSDSAQEFVTQVSKLALESTTSQHNSTQPPVSNNNTNNNNNNNSSNNNETIRLPLVLNSMEQRALLEHSDEWNPDSVGSAASGEYNSSSDGNNKTLLHPNSVSSSSVSISTVAGTAIVNVDPVSENASLATSIVQDNNSSSVSHRIASVVDSTLPTRLRTPGGGVPLFRGATGNDLYSNPPPHNTMSDIVGTSSIAENSNNAALPSVVTASLISPSFERQNDAEASQSVTSEKEGHFKNEIVKRTTVAAVPFSSCPTVLESSSNSSHQIAQHTVANVTAVITASTVVTTAAKNAAVADTTSTKAVITAIADTVLDNERVSSTKTKQPTSSVPTSLPSSSVYQSAIPTSSFSSVPSSNAPSGQKLDTLKQQHQSSFAAATLQTSTPAAAVTTIGTANSRTSLPAPHSSQHPLRNDAHENRIVMKPNDHLPKGFSTKPTEKIQNASSRDDNKPSAGNVRVKKQQYKDANEPHHTEQHYATTAKSKSTPTAHSYKGSTNTASETSSGRSGNMQHSKQTNGETNISDASTSNSEGKTKKKGKKKEGKKGQEKEVTDMDAIFDKPQIEKPSLSDKVQSVSNARAANNTNQTSKVNSSHKTPNKSKQNEETIKHEKSATAKNESLKSSDNTFNKSVGNAKSVQDNKRPEPKAATVAQTKSSPSESKPTVTNTEPKQLVDQREKPITHDKHKSELKVTAPVATGRRKYTLQQLQAMKDSPLSKHRINIPSNLYVVDKEAPITYPSRSISQSNYGGSPNYFVPDFAGGGNRYANVPMRRSQQGAGKRDKPPQIHVTLSLGDDVQLHQSEQAWKPDRFGGSRVPDEERETRELNKAFTGILNKLTPQKFDTLVNKIKALPINTLSRLEGVIDLIFQKAIDEPGFCKTYAQLCSSMQTTFGEFTDPNSGKQMNFRIILINKCQQLFEKNKADELKAVEREAEINSCTDPEKKKELQLIFEDEERRIRRKSVGNCRFIGELFKLSMLTPKIMTRCMHQLLSRIDEEPLECLCKLLTTIGKILEEKSGSTELDGYFKTMKDLSSKKNPKISSRIRFMLLDVIDLRNNKWIPRRDENLPKTIDQIDQEFEQTQYNERMNASLMTLPKRGPQQDDRYRDRDNRKGGNRTGGSRSTDEGGWQVVSGKQGGYPKTTGYTVDATKFQHIADSSNDILGSANTFTKWGSGASGSKSRDTNRNLGSTSLYGMDKLSPLTGGANSRGGLNRPTLPSHSSMERSSYVPNRGSSEQPERHIRNSGSGNYGQNVHSSRDNSSKMVRPSSTAPQPIPVPSPSPNLDDSDIELKSKATLEEYCAHTNIDETISFLQQWLHTSYKDKMVGYLFQYVMEKNEKYRTGLGRLFADMISKSVLESLHIFHWLQEYVDLWAEMIIDYPNYWEYLAEIIVPILAQDRITFEDVRRASERIYHTPECGFYISHILAKAKQIMGSEKLRSKWSACQLSLTNFVKPESEAEFIANFNLQDLFVHNREEEFKSVIKQLLTANRIDDILNYIKEKTANDNESRKSFIRILHVILEVDYNQGDKKKLYSVYNVNMKYLIDNHEEELEVLCLTSVRYFVNKLEFPSGLLLNLFERLWDDHIISTEGFLKWKELPFDNKGVCMKQLESFYNYIRENPK